MYVYEVLADKPPLMTYRSTNTHSYHDPLSLAQRGSLAHDSASSKSGPRSSILAVIRTNNEWLSEGWLLSLIGCDSLQK